MKILRTKPGYRPPPPVPTPLARTPVVKWNGYEGSKYSVLEKPHIHDLDICFHFQFSVNNTMTKEYQSQRRQSLSLWWLWKEQFERLTQLVREREITPFLSKILKFIRLSIKVTEYARFQNNYFWNYNITVSFSVRILSVVVFPAICMRLYRNFRQHWCIGAVCDYFEHEGPHPPPPTPSPLEELSTTITKGLFT